MNRNPLPLLLIFATALSVYLLTLAPDITWAHAGNDGGDLITAAVTLGVPHPSGYPTYTLLGKLVSLLPFGTVAWRFNLFSALCMALAATIASAALIEKKKTLSNADAAILVATGLTFAFMPGVWKQAVITEVYGLNLLLLAILLFALAREWDAATIGIIWGLSITTHLTSLLFFPLVLFTVAPKKWLRLCLFVPLGLLPLVAPAILARGDSPVVWGAAETFSGWWWLVSGRIYRPNVLAFDLMLPQLGASILPLLQQFSFIGWAVILAAIAKLPSANLHENRTRLQLGGLLIAIGFGLYAIGYDAYDYRVFALPAALLLTPLLYEGLKPLRYFALALPLLALALHFQTVSQHGDFSVRTRAESALEQISAEAIVITPGDQSLFTLWYLHYVEGYRPDIVPVDSNMLAFDWYRARLQRLYPDLQSLTQDDLTLFRETNGDLRPICDLSIDPTVNVQCKSSNGND